MATERGGPRVAMVTSHYLPDRGGTAIHTHEVARRMTPSDIEVTVITAVRLPTKAGSSIEDGVRVRRVRAYPRRADYFFAPGIVPLLRRDAFDLLHCQGYHTFVAPLAMLTALVRRLPYVVTFHSGGHSSRLRSRLRPLQWWLLGPLLRRARALIAVSRFEAEFFARRLRVSPDAIRVIPSGVELPLDAGERDESIDPEDFIASVGRVERYKGHHRVIEALPLIRQAVPDMRLRVVGSGPYEGELHRLANVLGVGDAVEIAPVDTGDRADLARLLRRSRVVTLLSEYESQGLAAYEALALGRPLLVNDEGALSELRGQPNVRVVAQDAPAVELADSITQLATATPAPPPPVPTWAQCVGSLVALYNEVLTPTPDGGCR